MWEAQRDVLPPLPLGLIVAKGRTYKTEGEKIGKRKEKPGKEDADLNY